MTAQQSRSHSTSINGGHMQQAGSKKSNEWYTPAKYIEAAREVFGGKITLDPASCEMANRTVKATRYYTKEDNGLMQDWSCQSLWLNPPFSREGMSRGLETGDRPKSIVQTWINRLLAEYQDGNVTHAILLTKADPKQRWFQPLWDFPICFSRERVFFERPGLEPEKHMFGTCFVYLGPNEQKFTQVFSQFGRIVRAIDEQKPKPVMRELWSATKPLAD